MKYVSDCHKLLRLGNLYHYLEYISEKYPSCFVVQMLKGREITSHTYKDLARDAKIVGNYLINNGLHKQHISIIGNFCYEWLVTFFALLYSNNVVVPIDHGQSRDRILGLLNGADTGTIIAQRKVLSGDHEINTDQNINQIIYFEDLNRIISSDAPNALETTENINAPFPSGDISPASADPSAIASADISTVSSADPSAVASVDPSTPASANSSAIASADPSAAALADASMVTSRPGASGTTDVTLSCSPPFCCTGNDIAYTINRPYEPPTLDSTAMIMYTSGTTGFSKGILLSHRNILHDAIASVSRLGEYIFPPGRTTIALLPPFHMFGISAGIFDTMYYGETLCYSDNTLKDIETLIKTFKPTGLIAVPQMVDGIHKKIWAEAKKGGKQKTLRTALRISSGLRRIGIDLRTILFRSITNTLGGNLHTIICGGAAPNEQVIEELSGFGINVLAGYGVNECSSVVSVNPPEKLKKGSIGIPIPEPFCRVKIKDDEIMISGSIVMSGYFKDPQGTKEAFDGEWFKTGDIGKIDKDGYLYITGRKKNLIILSDGNNVSPEELEIRIGQSSVVDSVLVYAEEGGQTPVLHASVYPNYQYCSLHSITDIKGELMDLISQINAENPRYMRIFDVSIRDIPFEKTAIGKIKRYLHTSVEEGKYEKVGN